MKDKKSKYTAADASLRQKCGLISSICGITLNILLFTAKTIVGIITGSVSVSADAINNLSDAGSSVVGLISVKVSGKPADENHPFGHGRIEYASTLAIAFLILMMGIELAVSSVKKIIHPSLITYSTVSAVILTAAIAVKIGLGILNLYLSKRSKSPTIAAIMKDSFADALATAATVITLLVSHFTGVNIDGYVGFLVALFILKQGIDLIRSALNMLLGKPADSATAHSVEKTILGADKRILELHDLVLHDYGAGNYFGSVHISLPTNLDFVTTHEIADAVETLLAKQFGMSIVVHADPINTDDGYAMEVRCIIKEIVQGIDEHFKAHEIKIIPAESGGQTVEFDLSIDADHKLSAQQITKLIETRIHEQLGSSTDVHINYEYSFTNK